MKEDKKIINIIILVVTLILFVFGSAYAYFSINSVTDNTSSKASGSTNKFGTVAMINGVSNLFIKFVSDEMSEEYKGVTYYANTDSIGTPLTTDPSYNLTTILLTEGDEVIKCTYKYKLTASVGKPISDNSDNDVKITIGTKTYTLKEILAAGSTGVIVSDTIIGIESGIEYKVPISASVTNSSTTQDDLASNSFKITIAPYIDGNNKAISCSLNN